MAHEIGGQDRPSIGDELNTVGPRKILRRYTDGARGSRVGIPTDRLDAGVGVRAADRGSEQRTGHGKVAGVDRRPADFREPVGPRWTLTDLRHEDAGSVNESLAPCKRTPPAERLESKE